MIVVDGRLMMGELVGRSSRILFISSVICVRVCVCVLCPCVLHAFDVVGILSRTHAHRDETTKHQSRQTDKVTSRRGIRVVLLMVLFRIDPPLVLGIYFFFAHDRVSVTKRRKKKSPFVHDQIPVSLLHWWVSPLMSVPCLLFTPLVAFPCCPSFCRLVAAIFFFLLLFQDGCFDLDVSTCSPGNQIMSDHIPIKVLIHVGGLFLRLLLLFGFGE